jgi:hypothetical protein
MTSLTKRISLFVFACLTAVLILIPVTADPVSMQFTLIDSDLSCASVYVEFAYNEPPSGLRTRNGSATVAFYVDNSFVGQAFYPVGGSAIQSTYNFDPPLTGNHTVRVDVTYYSVTETLFEQSIDCLKKPSPTPDPTPDPEPLVTDGRFCFAPGQAPAALYSYTDGAGKTGLKVYAITGANGTEVINLDSAELAALPGLPGETTLIATGSPYNIALYKLPSGAFQINVADARVAKTHVCEFRGVPAFSTKVYTIE